MKWFEELPPDCPPADATPANGQFYRLGSIPPEDSDFWSHRMRFPDKFFQVSECQARSVSIFDSINAVEKLQRRYPILAKKPIFKIDLTPNDGLSLQTGEDEHHFSWWRSTEFQMTSIKIIDS
jgi:hypothetical protein